MYQMIVVDDEAELREGISNYFPWESLNIRVTGIFENGRTAFVDGCGCIFKNYFR